MKETLGASSLEALLESAQLLHASLDLKTLLQHLLRTVMGRLLAAKGFIAVVEDGEMRMALVRGLRGMKLGDVLLEEEARSAGVETFLPIGDPADPVGMLGLGRLPRSMTEADREFLKALLGIAASGIGNARSHAEAQRLNLNLSQKLQDLRTLLELTQSLTSTLEPESIAQILSLTLTGRWAVSKHAIAAFKDGHAPVLRERGMKLPPAPFVLENLASTIGPTLVKDLDSDELREALEAQRAVVVFPLRSGEDLLGAIVLGPRLGGLSYSGPDLEFGGGLVSQAVVAFENSWHFNETLEKKKMEQELGVAASIQKDLFPSSLPGRTGFELDAHSLAARVVGGDYYDALTIESEGPGEDPLLICVADVSGKGIPASLLMSSIQATLRALLRSDLSLVELTTRTSELLYATTPANKYATAILIRVDPNTGRVDYVNAGHNDGILVRADGEVEFWKSTGPPIGLIPGIPFGQESVEIGKGDLLALYSDGVVEAQNLAEEEYETDRFLDCLREGQGQPLSEIVQSVYESIDRFAADAPQHDDITLLLLRRSG